MPILTFKDTSIFIFLMLLFLLPGCRKYESKESILLDKAEELIKLHPDSTILFLDSIEYPEGLNDRLLAKWCLLYGIAVDKAKEGDVPSVYQLSRALKYYEKHRDLSKSAKIGLYLGRSYVNDKEYEKAMEAYDAALNIAIEVKNYNIAGYILSYMGDLYEINGNFLFAVNKYEDSSKYFKLANNDRSYIFGLVNTANEYLLCDSIDKSLSILYKAENEAIILNDKEILSCVYNGLGITYCLIHKYKKAEYYYLKSIESYSIDSTPNYVGLAEVYSALKDWDKAEMYLDKSKTETKNKYTAIGITENYYLLEKAKRNYSKALEYLEKYSYSADSISKIENNTNVLATEKKYNYMKLHNENMQLKINRQIYYIIASILLLCIFTIAIIHLLRIRKKNIHILNQQVAINEQNRKIYALSVELNQKKDILYHQKNQLEENSKFNQLKSDISEEEKRYMKLKKDVEVVNNKLIACREERILLSPIGTKLYRWSEKVQSNISSPLISSIQWKNIENLVKDVYPIVYKELIERYFTQVEKRFCYLCLFKLDTRQISILLNINPESVNKQRFRSRQKFDLVGTNEDLYVYLVNL
ncbi:MAG: hypothetical protein PARBA_01630 [Parabacteroides sp.]